MSEQPLSPAAEVPQRTPAAGHGADVVVCAADECYALPLAVMLESLLANAEPAVPLEVYIVDCGLCYPPGDTEALAAALRSIAGAESVSPRGLEDAAMAETARRFSRQRHVAALREILQRNAANPQAA